MADGLGGGRRAAVRVTINDHSYRSSVAVRSGRYLVGDSAEVRDAAGVAAGDGLDVDLELDAAPREVTAPPDLAAGARLRTRGAALLRELVLQQQRWFVDGIEQAAKPETRQRRVAGAVARLREGHGQR